MSEEFMKVGDLKTYSRRVNVKVKVLSKTETREVASRRSGSTLSVAEALVGDDTGCVLLNLWEEDIEKVDEGDIITITNGYVKLFKGSMRLNIGRYGQTEKIEEDIPEVNTENNLSEKTFPFQRERSRY
jgi:replication factor A1